MPKTRGKQPAEILLPVPGRVEAVQGDQPRDFPTWQHGREKYRPALRRATLLAHVEFAMRTDPVVRDGPQFQSAGGAQPQLVSFELTLVDQCVEEGVHGFRGVSGGDEWSLVDLRRGSETHGKWTGIELSDEDPRQLWIPPGFAHGFVVLNETVLFSYKTTAFYDAASERSIVWNDPQLAVGWPLPEGLEPLVADKDGRAPPFAAAEFFS